eukprot:CAMPEP_0114112884 /NCGR_PEP_ID=MMETSP0043_2-20121206/2620_1 /TAXON_ID=464988 /ORGANISM="Hemiselmis andersenii, Strain CCMP644" /LENGTH=1168 /DNA_ID=CAMNT_0001205003 /DNA_START=196 /DNA_END=3702 /DNA_ORIENTATION=-
MPVKHQKGMMSKLLGKSASVTMQVPDDLPHWMKEEQFRATSELVRNSHPSNRVRVLRGSNQKQQLEEEAWKAVFEMFLLNLEIKADEDARAAREKEELNFSTASLNKSLEVSTPRPERPLESFKRAASSKNMRAGEGSFKKTQSLAASKESLFKTAVKEVIKDLKQRKLETLKENLFQELERNEQMRTEPGPVGDIPLHACFLLGLADVGKELVDKFYSSDKKVNLNTPYLSDLDFWKQHNGVLDQNDPYDDGGLYTGETCLHIAIVQTDDSDPELVRWFLKKGAMVTVQATGAFFKGPVIKRRANEGNQKLAGVPGAIAGFKPSRWQRLVSWLQSRERDKVPGRRTLHNAFSACDYGEFPLSFAASVGSIEICRILCEHEMPDEEWKAFVVSQRNLMRQMEELSPQQSSSIPARSDGDDTDDGASEASRVMRGIKHEFLSRKNPGQNKAGRDVKEAGVCDREKGEDLDFDLFVNAQDTTGNTALHMAVLHKQLRVIDWLIAHGGKPSLTIMNMDGLTPFTLAAKMGSGTVLYHILNTHMRDVSWAYGSVSLAKTSLEQMDSFRVKDHPLHTMSNWRSAIEIIVEHEVVEFAKDDLFNKLIREKWDNFGRRKYLASTMIPYLIFLLVFTVAVTLRCIEVRERWELARSGHIEYLSGEGFDAWLKRLEMPGDKTGLTPFQVRRSMAIMVLHLLLGLPGAGWTLYKGWIARRMRRRDLDPEEDGHRDWVSFAFKNMTFMLNSAAGAALFISLISRLLGDEELELDAWAFASIVMWCSLLVLIVPFHFFGFLIITTYRMLVGDIMQFAAAYVITTLGFSFAIYALYQLSPFPDETNGLNEYPTLSVMNYFWVSLADSVDIDLAASRSPGLLLALHLIYILLTTWLLLNLLIAMMGQTFERNAEDTHKTWIFPFASLVLHYEKNLTEAEKRDTSGRFRSGKFAGNEDEDKDDKDKMWKAVFYEIEVGVNKEQKIEEERRRNYEAEHKAVLDKIDENVKSTSEVLQNSAKDAAESLGLNRPASASRSVTNEGGSKKADLEKRLEKVLKELGELTQGGGDLRGTSLEDGGARPRSAVPGRVRPGSAYGGSPGRGSIGFSGSVAVGERDALQGGSPRKGLMLKPLPKLVLDSRDASPAQSSSTRDNSLGRGFADSPQVRTPVVSELEVVAERHGT